MNKEIECKKLGKMAEALDSPPMRGALGERIFQSISREGWALWLNHQTMLINEYRLSLIDPEAKRFLEKEMEQFLFGGQSQRPPGYVPPDHPKS